MLVGLRPFCLLCDMNVYTLTIQTIEESENEDF